MIQTAYSYEIQFTEYNNGVECNVWSPDPDDVDPHELVATVHIQTFEYGGVAGVLETLKKQMGKENLQAYQIANLADFIIENHPRPNEIAD